MVFSIDKLNTIELPPARKPTLIPQAFQFLVERGWGGGQVGEEFPLNECMRLGISH